MCKNIHVLLIMDNTKPRNNMPPDGGWGWVIVFANALSNTVSLPVLTGFGLIFKDKLSKIGMPVTDITTITSSNSACSMLIGLVTGPLLKYFGYRKVALTAGVLFTTGVLLTAFSNSFSNFILSYSILTASGYGLSNSSFSLALNTYFVKRRSKAAGTAVTITGFGPILYPALITALLSFYGVNGCVLILAGLSLHMIMAALLLQPIKYHLIHKTVDEELVDLNNELTKNDKQQSTYQVVLIKSNGNVSDVMELKPKKTEEKLLVDRMNQMENYRYYGFDNPIEESSNSYKNRSMRISDELKSNGSLIGDNKKGSDDNNLREKNTESTLKLETNLKVVSTKEENALNQISVCGRIVRFFDLDLLKDLVFLNIITGMAIATFAEISFSTLTPFILSEMTFSIIEIATFLSTLSIADIISRFIAPFVGDYYQISARVMYISGLLMLVICRMSVLLCNTFTKLLVAGVCLGMSKGVRTVYMILVIPNHVAINKLASASGIRMVANGMVLLCLGPVVGWIRDFSGSYVKCIFFMNFITLICVTMWSIEILYNKYKFTSTKM